MTSIISDRRLREIRIDLDRLVKPSLDEVVDLVDELLQCRSVIGRIREAEGRLAVAAVKAHDILDAAIQEAKS